MTPAAVKFANLALDFELRANALVLKSPDTPDNFKRVYDVIKGPLVSAGRSLREPIHVPQTKIPRVGFYMPTATLLAHSVNLLTLLPHIKAEGRIEPIIYTHGLPNKPFTDAYADYPMIFCGDPDPCSAWLRTRIAAKSHDLSAFIFVSAVQGMAFATAMGLAPVHGWWAHKWHGLCLEDVDLYLDATNPFLTDPVIDGIQWKSAPYMLPELFNPSHTLEASRIRAQFDGPVFGVMVREEKLAPTGRQYAASVAEILRRVSGSTFVYTGRKQNEFSQWLEEEGVADRTKFIGWVDPSLWAQVIDIYLDSYPLGSGHCAYHMMAASKPIVALSDPEQVFEENQVNCQARLLFENEAGTMEQRLITRKFFGGVEVPWRDTGENYIRLAVRLAESQGSAGAQGSANRRFYETFMRDEKGAATKLTNHILEAINLKREQRKAA